MSTSSFPARQNVSSILQEGLRHHNAMKLEDAERCYLEVLRLQPDNAQAMHYLGTVQDIRGNHEDAAKLIQRAIALDPRDPEMHNNLGLCYQNQKNYMLAAEEFNKAVELDGTYTEAFYNLGFSMIMLQRVDEALGCFDRVVAQRPNFAQAYYGMGLCYQMQQKTDLELRCYDKALEIDPNFVEALTELGTQLMQHLQSEPAEKIFRRLIALKPDTVPFRYNLASTLQEQSRIDEALALYDEAFALSQNHAIRVKRAFCPAATAVHADVAAIQRVRDNLKQSLAELEKENILIDNIFTQIGASNFYLAYQGLDNRELNEQIGKFFRKLSPNLHWRAPHIQGYEAPKNRKIRVGFISAFLKNHTIGKLMQGLIARLPRDRFEVMLIRPQSAADSMAQAIMDSADQVVTVERKLPEAWETIGYQELDVLFYADIGMDAFTYAMSFARLAPVQCVTWGHPDTTGLPEIDYFLSSEDLEPAGAEKSYSETLVRLKELPTYYYKPKPESRDYRRADFNLPEDKKIYLIPQSLFKMHPDYDAVLGKLLRKDPNAMLILIDGMFKNWGDLLIQRFMRTIPDVVNRVRLVGRMELGPFLGLLRQADAVLDPIHFGGGNTTYECFSLGIPIVTLPGEFMRGRVTYACYKKMGVMDLVAKDADEYVELAYRLANDATWRQAMQKKVSEHSAALYENQAAVDEIAAFLENAVKTVAA